MAAEAGPSRAAVVRDHQKTPTDDELLDLTAALSKQSADGTSIVQLHRQAREEEAQQRKALEQRMMDQAPSYVKLHGDLQSSQSLLGELESFLDVFYTDLSVLSSQMSQLQNKSILLGQQLKNRRQLESKIRHIVTDIVLEPRYVDLIFADEATAGRAGLDVWKGCAERLSACLLACTEMESVLLDELKLPRNAQMDVKALREAKNLAEGCRAMAVSKIRPLLISTFAPLRSSLSTNMPVLQAVLLKSYRPLFMFLSHHAPRVAIDVQRSYVAAARLYFETGFRRYERSLGRLRDRTKARSLEGTSSVSAAASSSSSATTLSFTEFAGKGLASSIGVPFLGSAGGSGSSADPWMIDESQLDHSKIADGPPVTLAYFADDSSYRASLEALFRSLSLTYLDNASSEYCFLARFFESVDLDTGIAGKAGGSQTTSTSSAVKVEYDDARGASGDTTGDEDGPLPEESASANGDFGNDDGTDDDRAGRDDKQQQGTVVQLSEKERGRIRGRGAIDELWKQVMEPVTGTYNNFVSSLLAAHPPLVPLYTMLKLNERILTEIENRGVAPVLQGTFMSFKLKAWPTMQKQFDEAIDAVKRARAGMASSSSSGMAGTASSLLGGLGGFFGGGAGGQQASSSNGEGVVPLVCERYARLYSSIAHLHSFDNDEQDAAIFTTLARLRAEVEGLLQEWAKREQEQQRDGRSKAQHDSDVVGTCHRLIRQTLESGPASVSMPHIQAEMSHWTEAERIHRQLNKA